METESQNRTLDFGPIHMLWEITHATADSGSDRFEAINVLGPDFAGPPKHIHPSAEESYSVVAGTLDVYVDDQWRTLTAGESVVVPAGTPHTLKNNSGAEVKIINVHQPAMQFERFFRKLHALASSGQVSFPPKGLQSVILLSMLFSAYPKEIVSVEPPSWVMKLFAGVGRLLGYKLPSEVDADRS